MSAPRSRRRSLMAGALLTVLLASVLASVPLGSAGARSAAVEDYADYQPASHCSPRAKPGTEALEAFLVRRFGGGAGPISRGCRAGEEVTSEHQEGRALDWTLDARSKADRRTAKAFLRWAFASDDQGDTDVKARRTGIMYVIWNDRMYSAWNGFDPEPYLSSGCRSRATCSRTLRHRDHVHVSLTRAAAKGRTSWYAGRL